MSKKISLFATALLLCSLTAQAKTEITDKNDKNAANLLQVEAIKLKSKGSWTELQLAIQNTGNTDAEFECCQIYIENKDQYAIQSLSRQEVKSQIYNKAKTGSILGGIAAVGLGLGGAISGHEELGYAALGVGGASLAANVVGDASAEKQGRNLIIDDIMRTTEFPAGLKIAGVSYFPPKKKWPGSRDIERVHLTYKYKGKTYRTSAPLK